MGITIDNISTPTTAEYRVCNDEFFNFFSPRRFLGYRRLRFFFLFCSSVRAFKTRLTGGPVLLRECAPAARSSCRYIVVV